MKHLYLAMTFVMSLIVYSACKSNDVFNYGAGSYYPTTSLSLGNDTMSIAQVDSMVKADKLPSFKKWATLKITDAETSTAYIYAVLFDKTSKQIYTVKQIAQNKYVTLKKKLTK